MKPLTTTTQTYTAFRDLTVKRDRNLGNLVLHGDGLKCVNHHFHTWMHGHENNFKISLKSSLELRNKFHEALCAEIDNTEGLKPEDKEWLKATYSRHLLNLTELGLDSAGKMRLRPLSRENIGAIIQNFEDLKKEMNAPDTSLKFRLRKDGLPLLREESYKSVMKTLDASTKIDWCGDKAGWKNRIARELKAMNMEQRRVFQMEIWNLRGLPKSIKAEELQTFAVALQNSRFERYFPIPQGRFSINVANQNTRQKVADAINRIVENAPEGGFTLDGLKQLIGDGTDIGKAISLSNGFKPGHPFIGKFISANNAADQVSVAFKSNGDRTVEVTLKARTNNIEVIGINAIPPGKSATSVETVVLDSDQSYIETTAKFTLTLSNDPNGKPEVQLLDIKTKGNLENPTLAMQAASQRKEQFISELRDSTCDKNEKISQLVDEYLEKLRNAGDQRFKCLNSPGMNTASILAAAKEHYLVETKLGKLQNLDQLFSGHRFFTIDNPEHFKAMITPVIQQLDAKLHAAQLTREKFNRDFSADGLKQCFDKHLATLRGIENGDGSIQDGNAQTFSTILQDEEKSARLVSKLLDYYSGEQGEAHAKELLGRYPSFDMANLNHCLAMVTPALTQFKQEEKLRNSLAGNEFKTNASEYLEKYLTSRKDNSSVILNEFGDMNMKIAALRDKVENYYLTGANAEAHRKNLFHICPGFEIENDFHFEQLVYPVLQQLESGLGKNL